MSDKDEQHGLQISYLCTCNKNQLVRKHTFYSKVCFRTKIQISKMKLFNESLHPYFYFTTTFFPFTIYVPGCACLSDKLDCL